MVEWNGVLAVKIQQYPNNALGIQVFDDKQQAFDDKQQATEKEVR